MLPKLNTILVWFWAPFLLAAVLGFRLAVGAAVVLIILACTVVGACRPFFVPGAARAH